MLKFYVSEVVIWMKKILLVIFVVTCFMTIGCVRNVDKDENDNDKVLSENITLDEYLVKNEYSKIGNIKCDEITNTNIKRIGHISKNSVETYMILSNNEKYNLSIKLYSTTNTNCQKASSDISTNFILGIYLNGSRDVYISKNYDRSFVIFNDNTLGKIEIDDGEIQDDEIVNVTINFQESNEKLINLNGNGDYPILKTNAGFYRFSKKLLNEKECSTYVDIKCKYEYIYSLDEISKYYNEIIYYDRDIILDKSMNLYTRFNYWIYFK